MAKNNWNLDRKCPECKQKLFLLATGICHECQVSADERDVIVIDGEECVPGGFRL